MKYIRNINGTWYEKHMSLAFAYANVQFAILSIAFSIGIGGYLIIAASTAAIISIILARKKISGRARTYMMLMLPNLFSVLVLLLITR
ncbi:MAG: hypothetical protein M1520_01975 [Candidatus Marsarchaeota archaeon]|nr:hypothetical protein [Candidatus Marsarchaeota archaeon]